MEAALITKDAKESISKLTDEGNRLRSKIETLRTRYKRMLEEELERVSYASNDLLEEFEKEFLPASMTSHYRPEFTAEVAPIKEEPKKTAKEDLKNTIVNLKF